MILVTLRIVIPTERRDEVIKTITSLLGPAQVQPGCANYRFYQEINHENSLILMEEWESQEDLDRYIRSDQYRKILAVMDMSSEEPEVKFNMVSQTAEMEFVKATHKM